MFPEIKIIKARFELNPLEKIILPEYKGSTFRGAFGIAFKKSVCIFKRLEDCSECIVAQNCVYLNIFETPIPKNIPEETLKFLRINKIEKAPHPFISEPPKISKREYEKGEELYVDILILGKSMQYFPYFVHSVSELGKTGIGKGRGKFEIENILIQTEQKKNKNIFDKEKFKLKEFENNFFININPPKLENELRMEFITPVRIQQKGIYLTELNFENIIVNLIRRIYTLLVFHYEYQISEQDIKYANGLIEKSKMIQTVRSDLRWYDWERYSKRQDTKMNLGGLLGEIIFKGDLNPFSELIYLGQYLHLGKNTGFGLGEYKIS